MCNNLCASGYGQVSGSGEHFNKYWNFIKRCEVLDYLNPYRTNVENRVSS